MRAVVVAENFSRLDRVDDEAHVAIAREPTAPMLITQLGSVADAIRDKWTVAAHVKNGRRGFGEILRDVKIRCDIEAGQRLEMQILDAECVVLELFRDDGFQLRSRRHGREAEHLRQLLMPFRRVTFPILGRVHVGQAPFRNGVRLTSEIVHQSCVIDLPLFGRRGGGNRRGGGEPEDERFHGCAHDAQLVRSAQWFITMTRPAAAGTHTPVAHPRSRATLGAEGL